MQAKIRRDIFHHTYSG